MALFSPHPNECESAVSYVLSLDLHVITKTQARITRRSPGSQSGVLGTEEMAPIRCAPPVLLSPPSRTTVKRSLQTTPIASCQQPCRKKHKKKPRRPCQGHAPSAFLAWIRSSSGMNWLLPSPCNSLLHVNAQVLYLTRTRKSNKKNAAGFHCLRSQQNMPC